MSRSQGLLERQSLSLAQGQRAVARLIQEAERESRAMAIAVVDSSGHVICSARMDGAAERVLRFAIRKAYTAAVMGRDTLQLKREMQERSFTLADYGDAMFTTLQGGLVARYQGEVVGAIGVGGGTLQGDEAVGRACLDALGLGS